MAPTEEVQQRNALFDALGGLRAGHPADVREGHCRPGQGQEVAYQAYLATKPQPALDVTAWAIGSDVDRMLKGLAGGPAPKEQREPAGGPCGSSA